MVVEDEKGVKVVDKDVEAGRAALQSPETAKKRFKNW
jgi:hypothetical protein